MSYHQISGFYYDDDTGNIFVYIPKVVDVSYEHISDQDAYDTYEAQIYLDGSSTLVQKFRPPSLDGVVPGGIYGKEANPSGQPILPMEDAPE